MWKPVERTAMLTTIFLVIVIGKTIKKDVEIQGLKSIGQFQQA